ncbi:MAG: HD domain-containing protein [Bacteroidota bacterium]
MNKRKIINDPVYGFITIPSEIIFDIIEHRWFQRLRRIQQLGLSSLVYPGGNHTRFQHTVGAMHLMTLSLEVLRSKGISITDEEGEAAVIAILMHDIGHGPFSHTLEKTIVQGVSHEELSVLFMERLNKEFDGKLSLAIKIFQDKYKKKFLHQLVSGQLDMDRLDYLNRDSFFTGVAEGVIGYDRIIKMLTVHKCELVVEAKGIYSIEKFIVSRRLMYWQVYLHKTVLVAEQMLVRILERARELTFKGVTVFASPALQFFLSQKICTKDFYQNENVFEQFALLDDTDVMNAIKVWQSHDDKVLSYLSQGLINRKLFHIELQSEPFNRTKIDLLKKKIEKKFHLQKEELDYLLFEESTSNNAYNRKGDAIKILLKDGKVKDIAEASDQLNISVLSEPVVKHFLCWPKEIR